MALVNFTSDLSKINTNYDSTSDRIDPNAYQSVNKLSIYSPEKISDQDINAEYNIYSKDNIRDLSDGSGLLPSVFNQPFIIIKPNDSKLERDLIKYDSRTLPVGSLIRDEIRIGKFLASSKGILFNIEQQFLQQHNARLDTRLFNITAIPKSRVPGVNAARVAGGSLTNLDLLYSNWIERQETSYSLRERNYNESISNNLGFININFQNLSIANLWANPSVFPYKKSYNDMITSQVGSLTLDKYIPIQPVLSVTPTNIFRFEEGGNDVVLKNFYRDNRIYQDSNGIIFEYAKDIPIARKPNSSKITSKIEDMIEESVDNSPFPKNIVDTSIDNDSMARYAALSYTQIKDIASDNGSNRRYGSNNYEPIVTAPFITKKGTKDLEIYYGLGNPGNINLDRSDRTIPLLDTQDKLSMLDYGEEGNDLNDLAIFKIFDIYNRKYIRFRSYITGITDNSTPTYDAFKYIGRAIPSYIYTGVERSFNFNLRVVALSRQELKPLYVKLNYLKGLNYPHHTQDNRMISPLVKLTLGDLLKNTPGFFGNINIVWDDDFTWELENNSDDVINVPIGATLNINFTVIGDSLQTSTSRHFGGIKDSWDPEGNNWVRN